MRGKGQRYDRGIDSQDLFLRRRSKRKGIGIHQVMLEQEKVQLIENVRQVHWVSRKESAGLAADKEPRVDVTENVKRTCTLYAL